MNAATRRKRSILRERRRGNIIEPSFTLWNIVTGMYSAYWLSQLVTNPTFAQEVRDRARMITDLFAGVAPTKP